MQGLKEQYATHPGQRTGLGAELPPQTTSTEREWGGCALGATKGGRCGGLACLRALPRRRLSPRARAGKAAREAGGSSPEGQFIRGVVELHDKYMEYVQVGGWVGG